MRFLAEKFHAVRVIERRSPTGMPRGWLALTLPAVALNVVRTISWGERASWLAWIWIATGLIALGRGRE